MTDQTMSETDRLARIAQLDVLIRDGYTDLSALDTQLHQVRDRIRQYEQERGALVGAGSEWRVGDRLVSFHKAPTEWVGTAWREDGRPSWQPKTYALFRVDRFGRDGSPVLARLHRDGSEGKSVYVNMTPAYHDYVRVEDGNVDAAVARLWELWRERHARIGRSYPVETDQDQDQDQTADQD